MKNNSILILIIISEIVILAGSAGFPLIAGITHPGIGDNPACRIYDENQAGEIMTITASEDDIHLKTLVSFINLGLIIPLFIIYAGIYRKIRSSFTFGLLAVIFSLGMYVLTSNPMIVTLLGGIPSCIGIFQIIPDLCATAALIILIRISLE